MIRYFLFAISLSLTFGACSTEDTSRLPDGSVVIDSSVSVDSQVNIDSQQSVDSQIVDSQSVDSNTIGCTYPAGPYGATVGDTIKNLSFQGFADPNYLCTAAFDQIIDLTKEQTISFGDFYCNTPCENKKRRLLWITVSSGWCGPCAAEILTIQAQIQNGSIDSRIQVINILLEDDVAKPVDAAFAKFWASNEYDLTFPVLMDPTVTMGAYLQKDLLPFNMLVDLDTMKILMTQIGGGLEAIKQKAASVLGS